MGRDCLLSKVLIISGEANLGKKFDEYYVPEQDMYVFYSSVSYDPYTGHFQGRRKLHDRIAQEVGLPVLPMTMVNYVSIDIKPDDRRHTYFSSNRRGYQLNEDQIEYLKRVFESDY